MREGTMTYQLKRTPPVKGAEGWHLDGKRGEVLLKGRAFVPECNLSAYWANAYWNGSADNNSHLAALERFYHALRDGGQEESQQRHGIVINGHEDRLIDLAAMDGGSLETIIRTASSWAPNPWKVEVRTPYGCFGYRMDKAGARQLGVTSSRDVAGPLAELVAATAARPLSAMELEPYLKEVFTPKIVPDPGGNGRNVNGNGAAQQKDVPMAR